MKKYIVLLKGINVGGHNKIPMAELRKLLCDKGFSNVRTYIQSGNILVEHDQQSKKQAESKIQESILEYFGFNISVLVKTPDELKQIFQDCPFSEEKKKATYFMMLHDVPNDKLIEEASNKVYDFDKYIIKNNCIYLYCEKGMGKSKFNAKSFEKKLNTFATARNYNTMLKLLSLSSDS